MTHINLCKKIKDENYNIICFNLLGKQTFKYLFNLFILATPVIVCKPFFSICILTKRLNDFFIKVLISRLFF